MAQPLSPAARLPVVSVGFGLTVGLAAGIAVAASRDFPPKYYLPALGGLVFAFLLVTTRKYAERVCLWAFLLATPLPMHVFVKQLEPLHGGGALGIYAQAPDFCLALLYCFWIASKIGGSAAETRSWRAVLAFSPFLVCGTLSILYAAEQFWAFCEWLRWVKVLLVLLYATRRLKKADVEGCLWVLAGSAIVQASVAILQFGMKSNLGLERLGLFGSGARYDLTQEILGGVALFRGSGLTSHPNFLASYLLLLVPLFLARAISGSGKSKILWYTALAAATGGLFSTMSRAAWAALLATVALTLVGAVAYKLVSLRRVFQLSLGLFMLVLIMVLSFFPTIRGRFEADFSESLELRKHLAGTAVDIASDHLFGGVGLNNYSIVYPDYNPGYAAELMETDEMITVVHNVFLLVLAELGAVGLSAFLLFYFCLFNFGLRGLGRRSVRQRATIIGLLAGLLGAMLFDLTEFSLWNEMCMYTVALIAGIIESLNPSPRTEAFIILDPPTLMSRRVASQQPAV